jgi:uncharacterized protein YceK
MRGERLLHIVALALAAVTLGGCAGRHSDANAGPQATAAAAERAPQDADLAAVMERFYQQVEGEHWPFADGMLTPAFHTILGLDGVRERYKDLIDLDVTLQQTGASTVVAHVTAKERNDPARRVSFIETSRLFYVEGQWAIDSIARRDVTPGTRSAAPR